MGLSLVEACSSAPAPNVISTNSHPLPSANVVGGARRLTALARPPPVVSSSSAAAVALASPESSATATAAAEQPWAHTFGQTPLPRVSRAAAHSAKSVSCSFVSHLLSLSLSSLGAVEGGCNRGVCLTYWHLVHLLPSDPSGKCDHSSLMTVDDAPPGFEMNVALL